MLYPIQKETRLRFDRVDYMGGEHDMGGKRIETAYQLRELMAITKEGLRMSMDPAKLAELTNQIV